MCYLEKCIVANPALHSLAGDVAEIGTKAGRTAAVLCKRFPNKTVHLFDTWDGHPSKMVSDIDKPHVAGHFKAAVSSVERALSKYSNYCLHKGIFPETAFQLPLCFLHIDVDLYLSTRAAIAWGMDNLVIGGVMFCDDYGFGSCLGAKKAWDEADFSDWKITHYDKRIAAERVS